MVRKRETVLIVPPSTSAEHGLWESWSKLIRIDGRLSSDVEIAGDADAFVFVGCTLLKDLLEQPRIAHDFLKNKIVFHLGSLPQRHRNKLMELRPLAYVGYLEPGPVWLRTRKYDFEECFLCGLKGVLRGRCIEDACEATREAWEHLVVAKRWPGSNDYMAAALALTNLRHMVAVGDMGWHLRTRPLVLVKDLPPPLKHPPRLEVVDATPSLVKWLNQDPLRLADISPDQFECFVIDRLIAMGLHVVQTGSTNRPDGGIDLIAVPKNAPIPFLLAVQAKHSRRGVPVSSGVIRDFRGAITPHPIDIGMVVTNTRFTPDAEWTARQLPRIIRLRGFKELEQWLREEISYEDTIGELPEEIRLTSGLIVPVPRRIE